MRRTNFCSCGTEKRVILVSGNNVAASIVTASDVITDVFCESCGIVFMKESIEVINASQQ